MSKYPTTGFFRIFKMKSSFDWWKYLFLLIYRIPGYKDAGTAIRIHLTYGRTAKRAGND